MKEEHLTFAAVSACGNITNTRRGVKPLLELIDGGVCLQGYSVADKVIGKAAAFLYLLLKPDGIRTDVISRPALEVLQSGKIPVQYATLTEAIRNRDNTGFCPMETAVMDAENATEALALIRKKGRELANF